MKKVFKILKLIIFLILFGVLLLINIKIYTGPDLKNQEKLNTDIVKQLNFLEGKLKNERLADNMQLIFPEGFVFTNALYGLSWCELAINTKNDSILLNRALTESRYAYKQINSDKAKQIFPANFNLKYGIYYRGWRNYLLAKILSCQTNKDSTELARYSTECKQIANAFKLSQTPFLESYPSSSWPADAFLAIASLKIYDDIISVRHDTLINNWISKVKSRLDPATKLIPHSVNPINGKTLEGSRGSSISLILRILSEIDPEFGIEQFEVYKQKFSMSILGFPAIREYPKGKKGKGDIDSGPVIFDIGFAGTIVGIGTLKCYGEYKTANLLSNTIETFGFPITSNNKKKYIFEKLPVADAFICWSRASQVNEQLIQLKGENLYSFGSELRMHLYCAIIIIILSLLFYGKRLKLK